MLILTFNPIILTILQILIQTMVRRNVNKEKALNFITSLPTNPATGGVQAQGIYPKLIESAKSRLENFKNPP
ncbi:hypothetical protein R80B4_00143 [Fibrobacteres bacterium R8-0-B4]